MFRHNLPHWVWSSVSAVLIVVATNRYVVEPVYAYDPSRDHVCVNCVSPGNSYYAPGPSNEEIEARQSRRTAYELNERGNEAHERGDWAASANYYREALRHSPYDTVIQDNLKKSMKSLYNKFGNDAYNRGDFRAAVAHYQVALTNRPNDTKVQENLANAIRESAKEDATAREATLLLQEETRRTEAQHRQAKEPVAREAELLLQEETRRAKARQRQSKEQRRAEKAHQEETLRAQKEFANWIIAQKRVGENGLQVSKLDDMKLLFPDDSNRWPGARNPNEPLINPLREPERYKAFLTQEREKFPEQHEAIDKLILNMDKVAIVEIRNRHLAALEILNQSYELEVDNALSPLFSQTGAKSRAELYGMRDKNPDLRKSIDQKLAPAYERYKGARGTIEAKAMHELMETAADFLPLDIVSKPQEKGRTKNVVSRNFAPSGAPKNEQLNNKPKEAVEANCTGWMTQNGQSFRLCTGGARAQRYCEQSDGTNITRVDCR